MCFLNLTIFVGNVVNVNFFKNLKELFNIVGYIIVIIDTQQYDSIIELHIIVNLIYHIKDDTA